MTFQAGNPGKQPGTLNKTTREMREIAQMHAPDAIAKLVALMNTSRKEQTVLAACLAILDRAYGKPRQEIETIATKKDEAVPATMTHEQLEQMERALALVRGIIAGRTRTGGGVGAQQPH